MTDIQITNSTLKVAKFLAGDIEPTNPFNIEGTEIEIGKAHLQVNTGYPQVGTPEGASKVAVGFYPVEGGSTVACLVLDFPSASALIKALKTYLPGETD